MVNDPECRPLFRRRNIVGCIVELLKIETPRDGDELVSRQMEELRDRLGSALRIAERMAGPPIEPICGQAVSEQYIRNMLKLRRNRDRFFDNDLFADPAWDILLELYASALAQFRVSISNLCIASAVPSTTALRWINQLENQGLVVRRNDPTDGRRCFIMLSEKALEAMNAYFRTVPAGSALI